MKTGVQGGISGLILAWANELTGNDNESGSKIPMHYLAFKFSLLV